jgi:hypothetical protein
VVFEAGHSSSLSGHLGVLGAQRTVVRFRSSDTDLTENRLRTAPLQTAAGIGAANK